jgi:hypothetical protein
VIRRLFTYASLLSLVLGLATAVLWVRSYFADDSVSYSRLDSKRFKMWTLESGSGRLQLVGQVMENPGITDEDLGGPKTEEADSTPEGAGWSYSRRAPAAPAWSRTLWQFGFLSGSTSLVGGFILFFPLWCPTIAFLIPPLLWWRSRFRRRRRRGACTCCGYSLTANTSGVCPECGTAVPLEAKS